MALIQKVRTIPTASDRAGNGDPYLCKPRTAFMNIRIRGRQGFGNIFLSNPLGLGNHQGGKSAILGVNYSLKTQ
jgi:hypothetical protein